MGNLEHFDPTIAVRLWISLKQRRPRLAVKAKRQAWSNGVFDDGVNLHDEDEPKKKLRKISF